MSTHCREPSFPTPQLRAYLYVIFTPSSSASISSSPSYDNFNEKNVSFLQKLQKIVLRRPRGRRAGILFRHPGKLALVIREAFLKSIRRVQAHMFRRPTFRDKRRFRGSARKSVSPVSSFTSRSRQFSGLSFSSKCPPTPIHFPSFTSCFFLMRCSIRYESSFSM